MINFANRLYTIDFKSELLRKMRIDSMLRVVVRNTFNVLIPLYYMMTRKGRLADKKRECQLIVSLTSFPLRIGRLWIVIESLLRQQVKPDRVILWLAKSQFPNEMNDLPKKLVRQISRGLEIRFVDEDIRSYKKFYYVFQEYPNDIVITADDDIMYPDYMIGDLYDMYRKNPKSVIARYCYEMKVENSTLLSYRDWKFVSLEQDYKSNALFFGSGGGTLFPPQSYSKEVLNKEKFLEICSRADDVWLNAMVRLNGTPIVKSHRACVVLPVLIKEDLYLFSSNICENDKYIDAVQRTYGNVFLNN